MKTYSTSRWVEAEHIDKGGHANWSEQLKIAEEVSLSFRETLGMGLDELRNKHNMFLLMRHVKDVWYHEQLLLGDIVDVNMTMWVASRVQIEFKGVLYKKGRIVTRMGWEMPLVNDDTGKPCRIPAWMISAIGSDTPTTPKEVPAST